ncbi:hypothetical protein CLOM_g9029 [Closterium sp. NIES-68]|nr:hypothetical protein CLOM_g9029 [Closterium sp. NIES-68]GJP59287.1 hypothetical protein CLOP_g10183 [Closterium sp. NIES-67]
MATFRSSSRALTHARSLLRLGGFPRIAAGASAARSATRDPAQEYIPLRSFNSTKAVPHTTVDLLPPQTLTSTATAAATIPCRLPFACAHVAASRNAVPCSSSRQLRHSHGATPGAELAVPSEQEAVSDAEHATIKPFQKEVMLDVLRHVPAPVVIVTAAYQGSSSASGGGSCEGEAQAKADDELHVRGMTCSSFISVSMDPPLISVCIRKGSHFLDVLNRSSGFGVHLLNEANKNFANGFARPADSTQETFSSVVKDWELVSLSNFTGNNSKSASDSSDAGATTGSNIVPRIGGTMAMLLCRTYAIHDAGDHQLLLGEVLAMDVSDFHPLIYMNRHYHQLGHSI